MIDTHHSCLESAKNSKLYFGSGMATCVMNSPPKKGGDVMFLPSLFCSIYHISPENNKVLT